MSPAPDLAMSRDEIHRLLQEPHTGVLSTIGRGGFPHSVGIYYLPVTRDVLELHMWVYGKSQKAVNVRRDPRASLLVEVGEPYADLRGVLASGQARVEERPDAILELGKQIYVRYFQPRTGIGIDDGPIENIRRQSLKRVNIVLEVGAFASWNHGRGRDTITTGGDR